MSLQQYAESISCDTIRFLDKKYDIYNNIIFKNNINCQKNQVQHISQNKEKLSYLNSININKKSCIDLPWDTDYEKELILDENPYDTNKKFNISFNENTRIKTR
jgi:hypothetical protein